MRNYMLFLLLIITCFTSCEDVVEVALPSDEPRLVLDALIRVDTSAVTIPIKVEARLTTNFFEDNSPASLDLIQVTNGTGSTTELSESDPGSGTYTAEVDLSFLQQGPLQLDVLHEGDTYRAQTAYVPTVAFDEVRQGEGTLFAGDETEVNVRYTDPAGSRDFYLFDFDFGEYLVSEDEFYQGQTFDFSYFYDSDLEPGQEVSISILGVNEEFFNYMNQVIAQSGTNAGGPFETPAGTVRGNIINLTGGTERFALGYFAVCQEFTESLTIE